MTAPKTARKESSASVGVIFKLSEHSARLRKSAEMILLVRRIAEAKRRLAGIESEIEEITASETYKLKLRVENAEAMGIDLFADLIGQVDRQVKKARNRLEHLRGMTLVV